ncbi:MAG: radical SAM protein [bacterium]|nr:radical SAM protein [bacterium]
MDYIGHIFRPPSEAESLLLQVTVGCSHNGCTYCGMYRDPVQRFRMKPLDVVARDVEEAAVYDRDVEPIRRVFLCDGDALVLPTKRLLEILALLRERLPQVRRVGIYGDARTILRKDDGELAALREAGLGIVYHGAESGDDEVLRRVDKGSGADDAVEAAARLRRAGIRHSVMVMLGIGGVDRSREHAEATARLLTAMDPPFVGALTTTLVPGTPLAAEADAGRFTLPDPWGMLAELRTLVADSRFTRCRFHSNHASNYVPLSLNLPADRDGAVRTLDELLAGRDRSRLRPEQWRGL